MRRLDGDPALRHGHAQLAPFGFDLFEAGQRVLKLAATHQRTCFIADAQVVMVFTPVNPPVEHATPPQVGAPRRTQAVVFLLRRSRRNTGFGRWQPAHSGDRPRGDRGAG